MAGQVPRSTAPLVGRGTGYQSHESSPGEQRGRKGGEVEGGRGEEEEGRREKRWKREGRLKRIIIMTL